MPHHWSLARLRRGSVQRVVSLFFWHRSSTFIPRIEMSTETYSVISEIIQFLPKLFAFVTVNVTKHQTTWNLSKRIRTVLTMLQNSLRVAGGYGYVYMFGLYFRRGGLAAGVSCTTRFNVSKLITCTQKCLWGSNVSSVDSGMQLHILFRDAIISTVLYLHIFITI
jgi:hypothetical protein